jgi:hypothetical protein
MESFLFDCHLGFLYMYKCILIFFFLTSAYLVDDETYWLRSKSIRNLLELGWIKVFGLFLSFLSFFLSFFFFFFF